MLPFATFSLYAALELFMTARANRPHDQLHRDLKLDVGTSTGELKLTLATGNLGGGKPQPEFQGGDWEDSFGEFETVLGAMILATGKGCDPTKWDLAKFKRYRDFAGDNKVCDDAKKFEDNSFTYRGKAYTLLKTAESVLGSQKDIKGVVEKLGGGLPTVGPTLGADLYGKDKELSVIFQTEVDTKVGRFSNPEGCLKERRAFPYFKEGFMELASAYQKKSKTEFVELYLMDLRGTASDLTNLKVQGWSIEKVRENSGDKICGASTKGERALLFTASGKLDWLSMALWDLYVVQAFVQWAGKDLDKIKMKPLVTMGDDAERNGILDVATYFQGKADIFFVQETAKLQGTPGCKKATSACTNDASIFLKEGTGELLKTPTDKVQLIYTALLTEVINLKEKSPLMGLLLNKEGEKKAYAVPKDEKSGKENGSVLGKVQLAVAKIQGKNVLLVSAHPDSDGILCAFQLELAKQVFEKAQKEDPSLAYLIVGMDVNLMTEDDFKTKAPKKNGYDEKTFYPKTVNDLGFAVVWPTKDTVNKQRTFLQTQLNKAGKHDQVKKDMVFIYPKVGLVATEGVTVVNKLPAVGKELGVDTYDGDKRYPTSYWPMDHCVSYASVTLK